MRAISLGSGSSGNAFLVHTERSAILIDCGVAVRSCTSAVRDLTPYGRVDAVLISHEHIDHIRALPSVLRRGDCRLVTTPGTRRMLRVEASTTDVAVGGRYSTGDLDVHFVGVAHDATEPCGFLIEGGGERLAIFTDLGHATPAVLDALKAARVIVLEANYDQLMLRQGRYPAHLKRRISGPHGHLSNDDCASTLIAAGLHADSIWLAHLSENNNHPSVAETTVSDALRLHGRSQPARPLPRFDRQVLAEPNTIARQAGLSI